MFDKKHSDSVKLSQCLVWGAWNSLPMRETVEPRAIKNKSKKGTLDYIFSGLSGGPFY